MRKQIHLYKIKKPFLWKSNILPSPKYFTNIRVAQIRKKNLCKFLHKSFLNIFPLSNNISYRVVTNDKEELRSMYSIVISDLYLFSHH